MFCLKSIILRKNTIDSSVKYIAQNEQTKEKDSIPHLTKNHQQDKIFSQNNKKFLKNKTIDGFKLLK